jgi:hypothetical protein
MSLKLFPWSSRISLVPIRSFRGPLFPKPVTGQELFFAVSYRKAALKRFCDTSKELYNNKDPFRAYLLPSNHFNGLRPYTRNPLRHMQTRYISGKHYAAYSIFTFLWTGLRHGLHSPLHGLRTSREEIAFSARPKIQSQSQIYRYDRSIFCPPHRPNFSDIFDLCLHWVSVVRGPWTDWG